MYEITEVTTEQVPNVVMATIYEKKHDLKTNSNRPVSPFCDDPEEEFYPNEDVKSVSKDDMKYLDANGRWLKKVDLEELKKLAKQSEFPKLKLRKLEQELLDRLYNTQQNKSKTSLKKIAHRTRKLVQMIIDIQERAEKYPNAKKPKCLENGKVM